MDIVYTDVLRFIILKANMNIIILGMKNLMSAFGEDLHVVVAIPISILYNVHFCCFCPGPVIDILSSASTTALRGFVSSLTEPWEQGWYTALCISSGNLY